MTQAVATIKDVAARLADIAGAERVSTDQEVLRRYGTDTDHGPVRSPDVVVSVLTTAEVQAVVRLANEWKMPVTPRSSGVGFYGAGIPEQGGIVIDMSRMKAVRRIDTQNRWALFEAGVTYAELKKALAPHGMEPVLPLLPHRDKSVVTSLLEREPRLTHKHHLDETILTMEVVLPSGDIFHTGSMAVGAEPPEQIPDVTHSDLCNFMGPGIDWFRLLPGSLGAYGIVTVMNAKMALAPTQRKLLFAGFPDLDSCVAPMYHLLRKLVGDECLLLNSRAAATILADNAADIPALQEGLPAYLLILGLTAGPWFTDDKISYLQEAVRDAARICLFTPSEQLPGMPGAAEQFAQRLFKLNDDAPYWKFRARGASKDVFFLTQLQRAPEFLSIIGDAAAQQGYPFNQMSLYLQPKQNGRAFHMEAGFPYNPGDAVEKAMAEAVHLDASRSLINAGAFFYRLYGPWADMVYARTGSLHGTLKRIKKILDPNSILSPGKLGF